MDGIAKPPRQSFRMRGRSYVALAFCPVVPIVGWLEEIDVPLARSPGFSAGKPDLSAVDLSQSRHRSPHHKPGTTEHPHPWHREHGCRSPHDEHAALLTGGRHCLLVQNEPKKPEAKPKSNSLFQCAQVSRSLTRGCDRAGFGRFRGGDCRRRASMIMGRFAVARWRVPAATLPLGSSAKRLKPSCWPSTASTAEEIDVALRNRPAQAWLEGCIMKITPLS